MNEIQIDKEKSWICIVVGKSVGLLIYWVSILLLGLAYKGMSGEGYPLAFVGILELSGLIVVVIWLILEKMYIDTLEYEILEDKLIKKYKVITQSIDTARLQVVNSVDVRQGLIEKIFGLYFVLVCYGFSAEGYYFAFKFLDYEKANEIADKIKSMGQRIKIE